MKRSAINKKSKKQSDYDREFEAMKPIVHERSFEYCESWPFVRDNCDLETQDLYHPEGGLASVCAIRATNVHHRKYRSRRGTNSLENLIDLCTPCHAWIHAHGGFGQPANVLRLALSADESEELTKSCD